MKRRALSPEANRHWKEQEYVLIRALEKFIKAITSIVDLMPQDFQQEIGDCTLFRTALKMLENDEIRKLSTIIFDKDEIWSNIVDNFKRAQEEFNGCWLNKDDSHIYYRIFALQMAFFCDVFHYLFLHKNLEQLRIALYWAYVLPELAKSIQKPHWVWQIMPCFRQGVDGCNTEVEKFVKRMIRFTKKPEEIIQNAISQQKSREHVEQLSESKRNNLAVWLTNELADESLLLQRSVIVKTPTLMVESIIKEYYRKKFEKYKPFYVDSKIRFHMNSWIPIKLEHDGNNKDEQSKEVDDDDRIFGDNKEKYDSSKEQQKLFERIQKGLDKNRLVLITGNGQLSTHSI